MSEETERAGHTVPRRFPQDVFGVGSDPDTRFSLANERTYLAWNRTSLALVAGAVAVHSPLLDAPPVLTAAVSIWLLTLAGICTHQGLTRWRKVERALRTGSPMPGFAGSLVLTAGVAILAGSVAVGTVVAVVQ